jgi:drug/metabolite transporter (DMT)-like permease
MILSAAILGRMLLHEPVTPRMAVSIAILLAAIFVLSLGADAAFHSVAAEEGRPAVAHDWLLVAGGVAAALVSGIAYTVLGVAIRYAAGRGASQPATLLTVALIGLFSLGAISLVRMGPAAMLETSPRDLGIMLAAGVFNALAFVTLTKALHLTTVVYVNALSATQATMAAVSGVFFFQEALSPALLAGVILTIVGLVLMRGRRRPAVGVGE